MKQNKAPEIDDITAELLQCASTKIKDALYQLTQDIYEKGDVPDDYRKRVIVTILKKSGTNSREQFRTLSLLNTRLKNPNKSNKSKNRRKSGAIHKKRPIWI